MNNTVQLQATIHVPLETCANMDASWVDIGVDVPPDLPRIFITISALVSDITLSCDIRAHIFSFCVTCYKSQLKSRQLLHVELYVSPVTEMEINRLRKPIKNMAAPLREHFCVTRTSLRTRVRSVELLPTVCIFM